MRRLVVCLIAALWWPAALAAPADELPSGVADLVASLASLVGSPCGSENVREREFKRFATGTPDEMVLVAVFIEDRCTNRYLQYMAAFAAQEIAGGGNGYRWIDVLPVGGKGWRMIDLNTATLRHDSRSGTTTVTMHTSLPEGGLNTFTRPGTARFVLRRGQLAEQAAR